MAGVDVLPGLALKSVKVQVVWETSASNIVNFHLMGNLLTVLDICINHFSLDGNNGTARVIVNMSVCL